MSMAQRTASTVLANSTIARGLHDAAAVFGDLGIEEFATACFECGKSAFLVDAHQPAVASDIASKDGSQSPLDTRLGHEDRPDTP